MYSMNYTEQADFLVEGRYPVTVCRGGRGGKAEAPVVRMEDMIERGRGNVVPLWLAGFVY